MNSARIANIFGVAGVALGAIEVTKRALFQRLTGLEGRDRTVLSMGFRELATGVGLLAQLPPGPWMWARAAGDLYDAAVFAGSSSNLNPKKANARVMVAFSIGAFAIDLCGALYVTRKAGKKTRASRSVTYPIGREIDSSLR